MNSIEIMIAEVRSAGDGCEASETLANWMLDTLNGASEYNRAEIVQQMAIDMLPLMRPDFFNRWDGRGVARNHEATGNELALNLLDVLLNSKTQAEACPAITSFLEQIANVRGKKARRGACAGAAVSLTDVLMLGIAAVISREGE